MLVSACNNDPKTPPKAGPKTEADSLEMIIDKAHNDGMGQMGKLTRYTQRVKAVMDSIKQLPPAQQRSAVIMKMKLDSVYARLNYAELAMDKWMGEFKWDTLKDDAAKRAEYLKPEEMKVKKMLAAIRMSISGADSLVTLPAKE